jgi:hypothetical protein
MGSHSPSDSAWARLPVALVALCRAASERRTVLRIPTESEKGDE